MKTLILRSITGVLFVVVMVAGILWSPLTAGLLFLLITALSVWEFTGIVNMRADVHVNRFITTVAAVCLYLGLYGYAAGIDDAMPLLVPWMAGIVYLLISELYLGHTSPLNNWAYTLMAQVYVALPFALTPMMVFADICGDEAVQCGTTHGQWLLMAVFIFLWCSDTGAYCTGSLIGRHKLFPRVSPGKTWEGSIGGGLLALAASQLIVWLGPQQSMDDGCTLVYGLTRLQWAGFALVVVVFGTWGDLVESLIKRQLGIKDSGNILPGHGGMLDRFDSSLLALPAVMVYLYCLAFA